MSQDGPSLSRLIKLLKMTTSPLDSEALVAMRMANKEAAKFGDWEEILSGKVTVIGDPFEDLPVLKPTVKPARATEPPPPSSGPAWWQQQPLRSAPQPKAKKPRSQRSHNVFNNISLDDLGL